MVLNKGWALLLEKKENLSSDCTFLASVALVTSFAGATAIFGIAFQGVLLHTLTFRRAASPVDPLGTVWKQIEANSSPENHTLLFFFFPHIVSAQSCSSVGPDYGENKGIILTAKKHKNKKQENKCLSNQAIHLLFGNLTWTVKPELFKRLWCFRERNCFSMCSIGACS